jgi:hypothetical protein
MTEEKFKITILEDSVLIRLNEPSSMKNCVEKAFIRAAKKGMAVMWLAMQLSGLDADADAVKKKSLELLDKTNEELIELAKPYFEND